MVEARETVGTVSAASGVVAGDGGVTVISSDAPSEYRIAPRSDHANTAPPHTAAPPATSGMMSLKKKRGRPRKYGPDGVAGALSPRPISTAAPVMSPVIDFSAAKPKKLKPFTTKAKFEMENLGEWVACSVGANFTPHIITVNAGEDVTMKIMSFSQQGSRAICILSANGVISSVTLRQPNSSGGTLTYEGRFEILSLSGSFMPSENGGTRSRSGGMSVSLAGPDGRVVGGGIAGLLVAAGPVQVVVGSFLAGNHHEHKPKNQKPEPVSTAMTTTTIPVSTADPKPNLSPTRLPNSWSSPPTDSSNKPTDINIPLPAG